MISLTEKLDQKDKLLIEQEAHVNQVRQLESEVAKVADLANERNQIE